MKVRYINEEKFIVKTWKTENKDGRKITIKKGDVFNTGAWGYGGFESVLTDKGEWICDVDSMGFSDLFEIVS